MRQVGDRDRQGSRGLHLLKTLHDGDLIFGGGTERQTIPATGATWIQRDPESANERVVCCL